MQNRQRQTNMNNNNISMTTCHKGGIKIRDTGNGNASNPFANVNPFSNPNEERNVQMVYDKSGYEKLDLNIEQNEEEEY